MDTITEQRLRRHLDKSEIHDVILRYAHGVDRLDMEAVRSSYHPDAYDDHGDYKGGVDGLIEWIMGRHGSIPQSTHFIGNCLVEPFGEHLALVETYFSRRRITPATPGAATPDAVVDAESIGRYVDRFERRNGEWRTARRIVVYDAAMTSPRVSLPRNPSWAWARRDPDDAYARMRGEIAGASPRKGG